MRFSKGKKAKDSLETLLSDEFFRVCIFQIRQSFAQLLAVGIVSNTALVLTFSSVLDPLNF